jgi:hypothetical protein
VVRALFEAARILATRTGREIFIKLQEKIPYSWLLDPTLWRSMRSFHAEIHDWREA